MKEPPTTREPRLRRSVVTATLGLAVVALSGCADDASQSPGASSPLNVSIYGKHASYWPLYIAEDQGYFEEEGLTVELLVPQAGSGITQSVLSGSVQLGIGTPDGFVNAALEGQEVRTFASLQDSPIGSLMVPEDLDYPDGIKGEIVAVSNEKSGDAYLTSRILAEAGVNPSEYQMLSAGGTPDRAASLMSGGVKAALIGQPQDFALLEQGFVRVGLADEVVPDFAWQWISGEVEWAEQNSETLERFLRAVKRGVDWWYDNDNRERAIELLAQEGNVDAEWAAATYDLWQERQLFERDLVPSPESFDGIVEFMMSVGLLESKDDVTYDEFVDLSHLEAAG